MSDDEVLSLRHELSRYMISEGFSDFETHSKSLHNKCSQFPKANSIVSTNDSVRKPLENNIPHYDHSKLMILLRSKLLLPEDFELLEFLISRTATSDVHNISSWVYSGSAIASTLSLVLYAKRWISFFLPASLVSTFSILSLRYFYKYCHRVYENQSFISAISSLQSLCLNVSKILRLLKETEILSTGQVNTNNVGSALYIPIKSLANQVTLPSWKSLPHLRKCLADTLLDVNDLMRSACDEATKSIPNWLHIEGYNLSYESFLHDQGSFDRLRRKDDCISLKDLQVLNDSYLALQSELLRWLGLSLCPVAWNDYYQYRSSRTHILKLFFHVNAKLEVLSFKLKMHYDIKQIFMESDQLFSQRQMKSDMGINHVQSDLHELYLLILSMLIDVKSLEDKLEVNANSNTSVSEVREILDHQLKNVRHEFSSAMDRFDVISNSFSSHKNETKYHGDQVNKYFEKAVPKPQDYQEKNSSQSDCNINLEDEVFLGITDSIPDEEKSQRDYWDIESKPLIPNSLLSELSTTLQPIKEIFREREKAALERAGLEDINNDSESACEISSNNSPSDFSSKPVNKIKKRRKAQKLKIKHERLSSNSEDPDSDSSTISLDETVNNLDKVNLVQNKQVLKNEPSMNFPVISDRAVASMIAMKSKAWGLAEEEYYSDS